MSTPLPPPPPPPSYPCPDCKCGFESPVNERTITLIVSNVIWAIFFGASEFLGYSKRFKSHSLVEFLRRHVLQEDDDEDSGKLEDRHTRTPPRRTPSSDPQQSPTLEDREWQVYKDWRDLREYRQYLNDRSTIPRMFSRSPTRNKLDADPPRIEVSEPATRKRTPSNDGNDGAAINEINLFKN